MQHLRATASLASGREGRKKHGSPAVMCDMSWPVRRNRGSVSTSSLRSTLGRDSVEVYCWQWVPGLNFTVTVREPYLPQESTVINASCLITQRIWVIWKGPIYMAASPLDRNPVFRAGQRLKYRLPSKINSRLHTTEASVTSQTRLFVWGLST